MPEIGAFTIFNGVRYVREVKIFLSLKILLKIKDLLECWEWQSGNLYFEKLEQQPGFKVPSKFGHKIRIHYVTFFYTQSSSILRSSDFFLVNEVSFFFCPDDPK